MADRNEQLLDRAAEMARSARALSFLMLGACFFSWIALGTIKDVDLILNRDGAVLPVINVALPTVGFFYVAPLILLAVFIYFHLYLQRLWQTLHDLPGRFPDGETLDRKLHPWLLLGIVRWHKPGLHATSTADDTVREDLMGWIGNAAAFAVAWWVAPLTIGVFWLRYWPKHDWIGTSYHTTLTLAAFAFGVISHVWMRSILRKGEARLGDLAREKGLLVECALAILLVGGLALAHWHAVRGGPVTEWVKAVGRVVPMARTLGVADLRGTNLSEKPRDWLPPSRIRLENRTDLLRQIGSIELTGQDFSGALMRDAFLTNAQLHGSRFDGADLQDASLEGTNVCVARPHDVSDAVDCELHARSAILSGVEADYSVLRRGNFDGSKMHDALLRLSDLREASFRGVSGPLNLEASDASNADFSGASLGGSRFIEAALIGAIFRDSDVSGSDFSSADLSGADLRDTDLQSVRMSGTRLTGANLSGADLRGARLDRAALDGAMLEAANLYGAELKAVDLEHAVLDGANLRAVSGLDQEALARAVGNRSTRLPAGADLAGVPHCIDAPYRTVPHHLQSRLCDASQTPCLVGILVNDADEPVATLDSCR